MTYEIGSINTTRRTGEAMSLTDFEVPPTRLAGQGLDKVMWAARRRGL